MFKLIDNTKIYILSMCPIGFKIHLMPYKNKMMLAN